MNDLDTLNADRVAENLTLAVQYVHEGDVAGDVAEFGTCGGATAVVLARAMTFHGRYDWAAKKTLHLFDSFRGLPEPGAVDRNSPHVKKGWWRAGTCSCPIGEEALKALAGEHLPADRMVMHAGWFAETLPTLPARTRFSLLHIDCDLYQSAKDVLEYIFGEAMVSPGCMIVFDDFNCNRASPICGERLAWAEAVRKFGIRHDDLGCRGWSARSFIVHGYVTEQAT